MSRRKNNLVLLALVSAVAVAAFFVFKKNDSPENSGPEGLVERKAGKISLDSGYLSQKTSGESLGYIDTKSLRQKSAFSDKLYADDLDEPIRTNQWFSSLYFSDTSTPLFAYPLVVKFTKRGFQAGYPNIQTQPGVIFGSFADDVTVSFEEDVSVFVSGSSDLCVQAVLRSDSTNRDLAKITITRGSPFVFAEILQDDLRMDIQTKQDIENSADRYFSTPVAMQAKLGLFFEQGKFEVSSGTDKNKLEAKNAKGASIFSIAVIPPDSSVADFQQYAFDPIENTQASFLVEQGQYVNTFAYQTRNDKKTVLALYDWQSKFADKQNEFGGFLNTIRGRQTLYLAKDVQFPASRVVPEERLLVDQFSQERKDKLKALVLSDLEQFKSFSHSDTYFHGKELLKAAQIIDLAMQLGLESECRNLKDILKAELEKWRIQSLDLGNTYANKYFVFDPKIKGAVGYDPSFGSEEFNDHHFHYGYFVHSVAILARYDKLYFEQNRNFINLLVKDYVNYDRNDKNFSFLRSFDLFEGHSWAAGKAQFDDGNNQESSSEAIHAYYGAYLWGKAIENEQLMEVSLWLYNNEIESAKRHWFVFGNNEPMYEAYDYPLVSLLWGGKVEWATWFSPEGEAKLAIQLLPIHAGSEYLAFGSEEINAYLKTTSFPQKKTFFDYLVMFSAFDDPAGAEDLFNEIENEQIDGGNSRSFMYAWISQRFVHKKNDK